MHLQAVDANIEQCEDVESEEIVETLLSENPSLIPHHIEQIVTPPQSPPQIASPSPGITCEFCNEKFHSGKDLLIHTSKEHLTDMWNPNEVRCYYFLAYQVYKE